MKKETVVLTVEELALLKELALERIQMKQQNLTGALKKSNGYAPITNKVEARLLEVNVLAKQIQTIGI